MVKEYYGGDVPFVSPADIDGQRWISPGASSLTEKGASQARILPPKSVLVSSIGILGKVGQSKQSVVTNQQINAIVPGSIVDAHFLFHAAHLLARQMKVVAGLQVVPIVNKREFSKLGLPLPSLTEQRSIADILDTLDDTIRKTEEIIAKLQQAKQGLLHDLLTRGIDENGELRDPERHPEQFKETVLGRVPSDWSVKRLTEIAEILDHLRIPINAEERERRTGNVPYYGANGQQGWIDRPLFCEPLVLLAEDGGSFDEYATRPIAYRIDGPSWVNNHAHVLKAQSGVNRSFFFFSLEHRDIRRYISGGTRTKLTQSELRSIEVAVPNLPEQNLLAAIMEEHESVIQHEKRALLTVRLLKQGLMDDLLTGKVRVPEAEEALA